MSVADSPRFPSPERDPRLPVAERPRASFAGELAELARQEVDGARYVDALRHASEARALPPPLGRREELELCLALSCCYRVLGLGERALDEAFCALRMAADLGDDDLVGRARIQLARAYDALGDHDRAAAEVELMLGLDVSAATRGAGLIDLGGYRADTGAAAAAKQLAVAAVELGRATGRPAWLAGAYELVARLAIDDRDPDAADAALRDARCALGARSGPWRLALTLRSGHLARSRGEHGQARERYADALRIAETSGARDQAARAHLALCELAKEVGDVGEALHQHEAFHEATLPSVCASAVELRLDVLQRAAGLEELVVQRTRQLESAQIEMLERLATAAERRDARSADHFRRVGDLSAEIAAEFALDAETVGILRLAARLHDVGKVGIPDRILLKPGPLDPDERATVEQHARIGAEILGRGATRLLQLAEEVALTHHECFDGTGYPRALAGAEIPLVGRIVAVVDVFDALTSERPYKHAWSFDEAMAEVLDGSGTRFDPEVVEVFARLARPVWD